MTLRANSVIVEKLIKCLCNDALNIYTAFDKQTRHAMTWSYLYVNYVLKSVIGQCGVRFKGRKNNVNTSHISTTYTHINICRYKLNGYKRHGIVNVFRKFHCLHQIRLDRK